MNLLYLVDTNVISAGAPDSPSNSPALLGWMERNSNHLCLSVVTIAEIEGGIAKVRRDGGARKGALLAEWLSLLMYLYEDRILPFDLPAAKVAGGLIDIARRMGRAPGFGDIAIAATAHANGLTVLTRNIKDFGPLEVPVYDPFLSGPPPE